MDVCKKSNINIEDDNMLTSEIKTESKVIFKLVI